MFCQTQSKVESQSASKDGCSDFQADLLALASAPTRILQRSPLLELLNKPSLHFKAKEVSVLNLLIRWEATIALEKVQEVVGGEWCSALAV